MNWWINDGGLIAADQNKLRKPMDYGWIPFERFEELTGKRINWTIRKDKFIVSKRVCGHLKLYDEHFITGQKYRRNYKIYTCEHIDKNGNALLIPQGNMLKALSEKNSSEWEIYENTAISASS